jgi:hypothetical protein
MLGRPEIGGNDFKLPKFTRLVGKTFTIVNVKLDAGSYGPYGVITIDKEAVKGDGIKYVTSGKVVLKTLQEIAEWINSGNAERMTLASAQGKSGRTYYSLSWA